jgi:hypothetical protein
MSGLSAIDTKYFKGDTDRFAEASARQEVFVAIPIELLVDHWEGRQLLRPEATYRSSTQ